MNTDYSTQQITVTIQHVNMEEEKAQELFDKGKNVGDWGWKHRIWENINPTDFPEIQKAARFFYGWGKGSEKVTFNEDGTMNYEAWYTC